MCSGPLRDWADDLLDEKHVREDGFFDPVPICKLWGGTGLVSGAGTIGVVCFDVSSLMGRIEKHINVLNILV
ncbi:hypothetical protein GCM10007972_26090 [Iodidimonas muriae]|uniref:Uncharacterized protein n=1 Tax=Iodidimonas muriae TaxID=261467 RepID=A0ABQ2LG47_9PROT|nr:hypothetical protein JCM17843_31270 [Kordiimonadales bacterium JCM 17843]GGO16730.1 hypothetical protein GCM10007972_26090 [Iodidimonas muriae]